MIAQKIILVLIGINLLFACKSKKDETVHISSAENEVVTKVIQPAKAELILKKVIKAHGGRLYNTANYSFVFRGDTYLFKNDYKNYEYSKISRKEAVTTQDFVKNNQLIRTINNDTISLTEQNSKKASSALNSVIYFATLPHKLNDYAVNKTYLGETQIKGENYAILGITFNKNGGGEDFEDEFHYWINTNTNKIDYLAYNYKVNKGGVRFRSAYNRRDIDGIIFQDYTNYKAELGTPLAKLPELYEANKLKEISKIKTENIINLNKN